MASRTSCYFANTVDFNPDGTGARRTSNGRREGCLAQFGGQGNFNRVVTFGSTEDDDTTDLTFGEHGLVHISGAISGMVDMDPVGTANFTSAGMADAVVAAYNQEVNRVPPPLRQTARGTW